MTDSQHVRIVVVDIGHGNATLIQTDEEVVLIDAGPGHSTLAFLEREGLRHIDTVVISHADEDHVGGLIAMISTGLVSIGCVVLNADGTKSTNAWRSLAYELDALHAAGRTKVVFGLRAGDVIETFTQELRIRAVGPRHRVAHLGVGNRDCDGDRITTNTISAVIVVELEDRNLAVLPGDMDVVGWKHLRENLTELHADVLVVPHHGGLGGSLARTREMIAELCRAVEPSHVFVSNGRGVHGLPRAEVINEVRRALPRAKIACTQLSQKCAIAELVRPQMLERRVFSAGGSKNASCAGSIDILFRGRALNVDVNDHESFVASLGESALCRVATT